VARNIIEAGEETKTATGPLVGISIKSASRGVHGEGPGGCAIFQGARSGARASGPRLERTPHSFAQEIRATPERPGSPRTSSHARPERPTGSPRDRASYTVTMRPIIPACEALASTDPHYRSMASDAYTSQILLHTPKVK